MAYTYAVETNVPLPAKPMSGGRRPPKYPFANMKVGDSFAVPMGEERVGSNYVTAVRLRSAASNFMRRNPNGAQFTLRTLPDEGIVRIWRMT